MEQRIFRIKKEEKYSIISNSVITDSALSWEARGVLIYLLSKPDDWEVRNIDLVNQSPAGEKRIDSIIKELKTAGYLKRFRERQPDGQFVWITQVYESPALQQAIPPKRGYGGNVNTIPPKGGSGFVNDFTIPPLTTGGSSTGGSSTCGEGGDIQKTDSLNTESQITELQTTDMHAAADFFQKFWLWINEPKRSNLIELPHVNREFVSRWESFFKAGKFPASWKNPIAVIISMIEAGQSPPGDIMPVQQNRTSEEAQRQLGATGWGNGSESQPTPALPALMQKPKPQPQPGPPPAGLEGARWTGFGWA